MWAGGRSCFMRDIPSSWVKKKPKWMIRKQNAKNKCGALCWQEGAETERIQGSAWGCQEHLRRHKWRDFKRQKGASNKFGDFTCFKFSGRRQCLKCHFLKRSLFVPITMNLLKAKVFLPNLCFWEKQKTWQTTGQAHGASAEVETKHTEHFPYVFPLFSSHRHFWNL